MSTNYIFRPFQSADQSFVQQLILSGLEQRWGQLDPAFNHDLHHIECSYPPETADFLVVTNSNEEIVGCGALVQEIGHPHTGRIVRVSVDNSLQGQGMGKEITRHLIQYAHGRSYRQILVETNDDWHSALRLYQGMGFVPYAHINGEIHMRLRL